MCVCQCSSEENQIFPNCHLLVSSHPLILVVMSSETFNVVLFGGPGVGKTSSLVQLREKRYGQLDDSYATEDTHYTEVVVDGEKAVLVVLDTATCT